MTLSDMKFQADYNLEWNIFNKGKRKYGFI